MKRYKYTYTFDVIDTITVQVSAADEDQAEQQAINKARTSNQTIDLTSGQLQEVEPIEPSLEQVERLLWDEYGTYADELIFFLLCKAPEVGIDDTLRRANYDRDDLPHIKRLLIQTMTDRLL